VLPPDYRSMRSFFLAICYIWPAWKFTRFVETIGSVFFQQRRAWNIQTRKTKLSIISLKYAILLQHIDFPHGSSLSDMVNSWLHFPSKTYFGRSWNNMQCRVILVENLRDRERVNNNAALIFEFSERERERGKSSYRTRRGKLRWSVSPFCFQIWNQIPSKANCLQFRVFSYVIFKERNYFSRKVAFYLFILEEVRITWDIFRVFRFTIFKSRSDDDRPQLIF